jgi:hypothetical protein
LGHITEAGFFSPSGSNVQSAQTLAVLGNNAILGRAGGLPNLGYKELYWLNVSTTSAISVIAESDLNASLHGSFVRDGLIFGAFRQTGSEFKIFSLAPALKKISDFPLPYYPLSLDCEFQNIYLSLENQPQLQILAPLN